MSSEEKLITRGVSLPATYVDALNELAREDSAARDQDVSWSQEVRWAVRDYLISRKKILPLRPVADPDSMTDGQPPDADRVAV